LEIRDALATSADDLADAPEWLQDPAEVTHGLIRDTQVRVYRAREYVQRLQKLKGEDVVEVDPYGDSDGYFVLEALGRVGDTIRLVSALVRETEPFSSFVFFQNQHTLGISGAPRGLIHGNTNLAFYFPNGRYTDSVSSVGGFEYRAGATPVNTMLRDANPRATPIDLEDVDFTELKGKATAYVGKEGLDAEIKLYRDGKVRIAPYTPPRYELVDVEETHTILMGYEEVTRTVTEQVQVGTTTEERTRQTVVSYETETYTVELPVYEDQEVTKTRQIPIYEWQTVTKTRWIKVFVPYDTEGDPAGGTTVGDSGEGILGEYVWIEEEYKVQEQVIVGYEGAHARGPDLRDRDLHSGGARLRDARVRSDGGGPDLQGDHEDQAEMGLSASRRPRIRERLHPGLQLDDLHRRADHESRRRGQRPPHGRGQREGPHNGRHPVRGRQRPNDDAQRQ
jgi:hypothetical protein